MSGKLFCLVLVGCFFVQVIPTTQAQYSFLGTFSESIVKSILPNELQESNKSKATATQDIYVKINSAIKTAESIEQRELQTQNETSSSQESPDNYTIPYEKISGTTMQEEPQNAEETPNSQVFPGHFAIPSSGISVTNIQEEPQNVEETPRSQVFPGHFALPSSGIPMRNIQEEPQNVEETPSSQVFAGHFALPSSGIPMRNIQEEPQNVEESKTTEVQDNCPEINSAIKPLESIIKRDPKREHVCAVLHTVYREYVSQAEEWRQRIDNNYCW